MNTSSGSLGDRSPGFVKRFGRDLRGIAATEFAILAPVLVLLLAFVFEVGHAWLSYQRFVVVVDVAARWSARFPMFEPRIREGIPSFVKQLAAPLHADRLNLTLRSATKTASGATLAFDPYVFMGNKDDLDVTALLKGANFNYGEAAIVVSGECNFKPYFALFGDYTIKFDYDAVVNPFYSRSYQYSEKNTDWDYWNVR